MTLPPKLTENTRKLLEQLKEIDPVYYAVNIGKKLEPRPYNPMEWQTDFIHSRSKRKIVKTCRQAGKSTTTAFISVHRAKRNKQFIIIFSPTEKQSLELMKKIEDVLLMDPELESIPTNKKSEKIFTNGSRILALTGSEKSARGYSAADLIIIDEASRVPDELYNAAKPIISSSDGDLIVISTPFGKQGFFWRLWDNQEEDEDNRYSWAKFQVIATEVPWLTPEFLQSELDEMGEYWFNQEYMGKFLEPDDSFFDYSRVLEAVSSNIVTLEERTERDRESGNGIKELIV